MLTAVHALKDVLRNVQVVAERVLDSDAVSINLLDVQIGRLREELFCLILLWVPQWLSSALNFLGSTLLSSLFSTSYSSAQNEGSGTDKGLGHFCLRLRCTSMG